MDTTQLADAAVHAKQGLAKNLRNMIDETDQLLRSAVHTGDQKFDALHDSFTAQVRHMRAQLDEIETNALHQAKKAVREADRTVRDHPYSAMGIAAAAGLLIGVLAARR